MNERESLIAFLNYIHPLPEEVMEEFVDAWKPFEASRKQLLTREGDVENYIYFVTEGIQRSYYIKDDKEHVIAFTYAPSFSGIPESFITQTPSLYYLECITPSRFLRMPRQQLEVLLEEHRSIERLFRISTEQILIGFIHRHYELLALSIEERFKTFLQRSPHLLNQIPHKHLASYLGMAPSNFSKLLGTVQL
ncbi:Crp/Fnr family transcriptional regulator [bacterium SCSIO 12741]|nr:Crp/Fnr family transcriptional regulator [bacterium SCSIO 12741]